VIAEGLGRLLLLVHPEAMGAEAILAAGLLAAALAIAVVLRAVVASPTIAVPAAGEGFASLRVLLRASDPSAPGHRRARAPGATG
jgi:hypothetical protein